MSTTQPQAAYRPDIDGLRAVAIGVVVAYHLGVGFTKGGYIGVDVFFVISGYLISGIIAKEAAGSRFSFGHFYDRRIRRLFPALFAAFAVSSLVALVVLFPPELEAFGRSLAGATLFVANVLFFNGAGYFTEGIDAIPLIHTWSLAVEEQFYLFFPVMFLPLLRLRRKVMLAALWCAAVLSFAFSLYLMTHMPEAAFYLLPARAWELLIGALLALGGVPAIPTRTGRQWAGALGLVAILAAAGAFNKNVSFPGWPALLPCLGAAAIIHSGRERDTWVHDLLARRSFVFLGLISYSLYVWHMPLIVFYKLEFGRYLSNVDKALLGMASLTLGALSWRFIERPFRFGGLLSRRRDLFAAAAACMVATLAISAAFVLNRGLESRYPEDIRKLAAFRYDQAGPMREGACFISRSVASKASLDPACLELDPAKKNYLLVGDSHAAHLWAGLEGALAGVHVLQATASGCAPILRDRGAARCRAVMDRVFNDFLQNHRLDGIIVAANWTERDIADLEPTLAFLASRTDHLVVVGPVPTYRDGLPRLLARSAARRDPGLVAREREAGRERIDRIFAERLAKTKVTYVSPLATLCPAGDCVTRDENGDPIQFDYGHLTEAGARLLARRLVEQGLH
ncbi:MAG: acyltransferase [Beijerinckiaceae bacterium]|nr:acyltransferase [Beijerinckiaceae bacterium]